MIFRIPIKALEVSTYTKLFTAGMNQRVKDLSSRISSQFLKRCQDLG
jgi:hypothetical protein